MTMVERMKEAIEAACREAARDEDEYCSPDMAKAAALAVLKAMRKPTLAMWKQGERPPGSPRSYDAHAVWGAMIDAAIAEHADGYRQQESVMDIPEGWKLVPIEPTKEMIETGDDAKEACIDSDWSSDDDGNRQYYPIINSDLPAIVYRAMLAVAPVIEPTKRSPFCDKVCALTVTGQSTLTAIGNRRA